MQKWNIATDTAHTVDEENVFICLVIMFTPGVMVIEMWQMALLFFFADTSKKPVIVWVRYFSVSERSHLGITQTLHKAWVGEGG